MSRKPYIFFVKALTRDEEMTVARNGEEALRKLEYSTLEILNIQYIIPVPIYREKDAD